MNTINYDDLPVLNGSRSFKSVKKYDRVIFPVEFYEIDILQDMVMQGDAIDRAKELNADISWGADNLSNPKYYFMSFTELGTNEEAGEI